MNEYSRSNLGRGLAIGVCVGILGAALFYWLLNENIPAAAAAFITPIVVFTVLASKV